MGATENTSPRHGAGLRGVHGSGLDGRAGKFNWKRREKQKVSFSTGISLSERPREEATRKDAGPRRGKTSSGVVIIRAEMINGVVLYLIGFFRVRTQKHLAFMNGKPFCHG
jgi:hypothetical protein